MKLLKIAKIDLAHGLCLVISNLCLNVFNFTLNLYQTFVICPNLIEAVGPYPNAPNLPKCF